jgi:putative transposase
VNTPAQYKDEFTWLREVDSLSLCNVQINLNQAYHNFFKNKMGFPKFKSKKKNNKQSYTTNNGNKNTNIRINNNKLKLPKLGLVKTIFHRKIVGLIKRATISRSSSGKYYVSIMT